MNTEGINTNRLVNEKSPYLLMHAHNPVDWYPWGEVAFNKASAENKLVIVSIGYAACHWCHVMEHESFSNNNVALIMNSHFVSVKVDREERPDIDNIYMNAAYIFSGQGGWPLNAIILPDGKPIFAITYLPPENWKNLLLQIQKLHETQKEELAIQADEITGRIQQLNKYYIHPSKLDKLNHEAVHAPYRNLIQNIDFAYGGLNNTPKFPMPAVFNYLLHYYFFSKEPKALEAVTLTLDKMALGGIYDHVGGGFARYSTDKYWKVPHFEKMLYDNAQLVSLYSNAYKLTKSKLYAQVINETLEFISREMTSHESGFYSAIDADSEGIEGKYYVWDFDTFKNTLGSDVHFISDYYSVEKLGNWEHGYNILHRTQSDAVFISENELSPESFNNSIVKCKNKLLELRNKRTKPLTDTKIIASWNALMIIGCLDAYAALGEGKYLTMATNNAKFIVSELLTGNILYRNYKDGNRYTIAKLDDYANVTNAFISLYLSTFDELWLTLADELTQYSIQHFYDKSSGLFYYTSDTDEVLITRQFDIPDQVIPSSNSVMALNLFNLGTIFDKTEYLQIAEKMVSQVHANIIETPGYFANWAILQMHIIDAPFEVAIVGDNSIEFRNELNTHFLPNSLIIGSKYTSNLPLLRDKSNAHQTQIFICKNKVCGLPINNLKEALAILK
jgi:uncharacterized protein YyaL (SSP411 family)